jgi:hypothetical protein
MEALFGSGAKVEAKVGPRAKLEGEYEEEEEEETKEEAEYNDAGCNIPCSHYTCPSVLAHSITNVWLIF